MGYIIKKSEQLVNVKLTDKGREQLSLGQLQFANFSLSDGEMVYTNDNTELLNILRPADNQPAATYLIPSEGTNYIVPISSIVSFPQIVHNTATTRGFFDGDSYIFDYMLCGAYVIPQENFQSGTTIELNFVTGVTSGTTAINLSGDTPSIGDLMLVKVPSTGYTGTILSDQVDGDPIPYLWYEIKGITGNTMTGFTVEVDRQLPTFNLTGTTTGCTGFAYFYKGGDMIHDIFDETYPYAYWSKGLLDFTDTCSNGSHDVPIWNMHVVYVIDAIGLNSVLYKGHDEAISNNYRGLHTYLKYAANNPHQNKFGIIHYTNNTVNNYYGEGFYQDTLQLSLPTLMWHKKQFGSADISNSMGYTFVCDETIKYVDNIRYYDLIDAEVIPTTVGKVFPDLSIIVIENEELITAMSLKSNRNWSLPKPVLTDVDPSTCAGSSSLGIITSEEELHVTYALIDATNGLTGVHCEDFTTIGTTKPYADIRFRFPYSSTDPLYSEFGYFRKHIDGIGFSADDIWIILQKTAKGTKPDPKAWYYFNANAYLGTSGCVPVAIPNNNEYELYSESVIVTDIDKTIYTLNYMPIGDVIVSVATGNTGLGHVLKEAYDLTYIYTDPTEPNCGEFVQLGDKISFALNTGITMSTLLTNFSAGDLIQFHYLIGTTIGADTVQIDVLVPSIIPSPPVTEEIYTDGTYEYIDLLSTPAGDTYVFFNGHVLSSGGSNYTVVTGGTYDYRVKFGFHPSTGSRITVLYLDSTGSGTTVNTGEILPADLNSLKVILNDQTLTMLATTLYDITNIVPLPAKSATGITFGDETFFFGNVDTDIKATIYKSVINATVLPNRFIKSSNPTFNENIHKVAFTEIDIYDNDSNVVAVGKFSEPLQRKLNSDVQIINAIIDF